MHQEQFKVQISAILNEYTISHSAVFDKKLGFNRRIDMIFTFFHKHKIIRNE